MAELADKLNDATEYPDEIIYLTSKGSKLPRAHLINGDIQVLFHDGFDDYRKQVLVLAPQMDAVILGAAVANLIPMTPYVGKFPSHHYKVGDRIPIDFTIAPRVIDEVKKVAPKTHLFGFKLLAKVPREELISAAYGVLLESHATAVFANDASDLLHKYAVTKERGVHPMDMDKMVSFIKSCLSDKYYSTVVSGGDRAMRPADQSTFEYLARLYKDKFKPIPEGYLFGTIAVRSEGRSFITTGRGKNELDDVVYVDKVDYGNMTVHTQHKKASLNAPLLSVIFDFNPNVRAIVHCHMSDPTLPTLPYAIPGTVRDSHRSLKDMKKSFNIENHGSFFLLDSDLNVIQ